MWFQQSSSFWTQLPFFDWFLKVAWKTATFQNLPLKRGHFGVPGSSDPQRQSLLVETFHDTESLSCDVFTIWHCLDWQSETSQQLAVNKMLLARNENESLVYFDGVWMVPWRCLSQSWWLLTAWQKLTSALRMPNSRQDKLRPGVSAKHAQTVIPRQKASWSTSYGGRKNHEGKYFTKVPPSIFGGLNAFHIACVHAGKTPIWASQSCQLWESMTWPRVSCTGELQARSSWLRLTILISSSGLTFHVTRSAWARRNFHGCFEMSKYCLAFQRVLCTQGNPTYPRWFSVAWVYFTLPAREDPIWASQSRQVLKSMSQRIFSLLTKLFKRIWIEVVSKWPDLPIMLEISKVWYTL